MSQLGLQHRVPLKLNPPLNFCSGGRNDDQGRMSKYGLTVHPEKTRLVRFAPPEATPSGPMEPKPPAPGTFDFLGFTHFWSRARWGGWVVKRKTARSRFKRALQALSAWCEKNLHQPIEEQYQKLRQKLLGHYGYYGITGNFSSLQEYLDCVRKTWKRWLSRRRRAGQMPWNEFLRLEKRYRLPPARVVHSMLSGAAKS